MGAPTSAKAEPSAFALAELTEEMGRQFSDETALYAAVRAYKFLRREYPGSKHRMQALLAIGKIYKNDLGSADDAQSAFEELLQRYPHSRLAKEAQSELAALHADSPPAEEAAHEEASNSDREERASAGSEKAVRQKPAGEGSENHAVVRVKAIEHSSAPDYTRITIDLEQDVQYDSDRLEHPERIFFDLKNARLARELIGKSLDVEDGRVNRIRMAQYKPEETRIVVETRDHANYSASLELSPPRLVIDVHDASPVAEAAACARSEEGRGGFNEEPACATSSVEGASKVVPAVEKISTVTGSALPKKVVVEADEDDLAGVSSARPMPKLSPARVHEEKGRAQATAVKVLREAQPTNAGDRSLIRALGLKIGKIVIDPGHGGHDTGTIGPHGLYEKDLVLDVSRRLGKLLEERLGAEVVFTRRDDTFIPLETRTAIANQEQADLFVSVHANSSQDPDARGVETYYLNFTSSPEALEVAARENAASDKSIHELQDLVKKIALKEKIEESREFAFDVQQSLHRGLAAKASGVRDRGVKKAPFVVLIGANMPSILAEISFISNATDERRLKAADYRQRIAESLYRGIARYVNGLGGLKVASKMEKAAAD